MAIQRRYQTNENACKALSAPPEEFDRAHALIESEALSQLSFVSDARLDAWLDQHSQRMISFLSQSAPHQTVRIAAIAVPNAFATGQNVTFHAGLVAWYLNPRNVLAQMGYSSGQINAYLGQYGGLNPGANGLLGVLAHETSHDLLGHPDVRPLVLACDDFINAGIREVHDYEQVVSTGHKSRFGAFFRGLGFVAAETLLGSQRQQQFESDADELGAWLAYRDTGDPFLMSKSLRWLAMYPGMQSGGGVSEIMCSDHPQLLSRVAATSSLAYSVQSGPPRKLLQLPQGTTRSRYEEFTAWYPKRIEQIDRIAAGDLTQEESNIFREVQLEVKPNNALAQLDGQPLEPGKTKMQLRLGPHRLTGEWQGKSGEYSFVVLDHGPDKFKLEIK